MCVCAMAWQESTVQYYKVLVQMLMLILKLNPFTKLLVIQLHYHLIHCSVQVDELQRHR